MGVSVACRCPAGALRASWRQCHASYTWLCFLPFMNPLHGFCLWAERYFAQQSEPHLTCNSKSIIRLNGNTAVAFMQTMCCLLCQQCSHPSPPPPPPPPPPPSGCSAQAERMQPQAERMHLQQCPPLHAQAERMQPQAERMHLQQCPPLHAQAERMHLQHANQACVLSSVHCMQLTFLTCTECSPCTLLCTSGDETHGPQHML